ncbi:MAG: hypothetical protein U9O83_02435 [Campylobacterota bacterium]|nr:hypothetical protein [Campylobacterota bacterium]
MSSLAIKFLATVFSISVFFSYILVFKSIPLVEYENSISEVSTLSYLPSISLSTAYIENRVKEYDDYSNDFYLGLKKETYRGFVYAK